MEDGATVPISVGSTPNSTTSVPQPIPVISPQQPTAPRNSGMLSTNSKSRTETMVKTRTEQ
ncbi:MAG: hypothetical protein ACXQS5_01565 [Candidatus Methanospirareceae archaeon]